MSKKKSATVPGMMYVKPGNYVQGVPARDMTLAEWSALTEDGRKMALADKLFEPGEVAAPAAEPTTESAPADAGGEK